MTVVAVTVLAGATAWGLTANNDNRNHNHSPANGHLPASLRSQLLFVADRGRTAIVRADGTTINDFPGLAATGYPFQPLDTGDGLAVFVHDNQAYRVSASGGPPQHIGAATSIFPADGGAVGLQVGGNGEPTFVEYMAADGTIPQPGTSSTQLPLGSTAVARLTDGLLVLSNPTQSRPPRFQLIEAHSSLTLGSLTAVVGTHQNWVAGLSCPPKPGYGCGLHLIDTAGNTDRLVRAPDGFTGFADGGRFSPDGSLLAAFVYDAAPSNPARIHLALIRTSTATVSVVGPLLRVAGSAIWSTDSHWVFYGGLTGPLFAEQTSTHGPVGTSWKLPLESSFAVTAL
ncbi:MAG: hypothetical protein ACR2MN_12370 [Acidimicrobiales bacterium]